MTTIYVRGEEEERIEITGRVSDCKEILKAHGYDPAAVDWDVKPDKDDRIAELEARIENLES